MVWHHGDRRLTLVLLGLPLFIMPEVVEDAGGVPVRVHNPEHLHALRVGHLLGVPRVGHRFVLVVLELDVSQVSIGHIFHVDPTHAELALPFVLRPDGTVALVVYRRDHLRHAAEVSGPVDREEEVERRAVAIHFAKRLVESLVTMLRTAPDLVLDRPVDVVLRVRLYHEESGAGLGLDELDRVVVVFDFEFVEYRVREVGRRGRLRKELLLRGWWRLLLRGSTMLLRGRRLASRRGRGRARRTR